MQSAALLRTSACARCALHGRRKARGTRGCLRAWGRGTRAGERVSAAEAQRSMRQSKPSTPERPEAQTHMPSRAVRRTRPEALMQAAERVGAQQRSGSAQIRRPGAREKWGCAARQAAARARAWTRPRGVELCRVPDARQRRAAAEPKRAGARRRAGRCSKGRCVSGVHRSRAAPRRGRRRSWGGAWAARRARRTFYADCDARRPASRLPQPPGRPGGAPPRGARALRATRTGRRPQKGSPSRVVAVPSSSGKPANT